MSIKTWPLLALCLLALCLLALLRAPATRADGASFPAFTWFEGEAPTSISPTRFEPVITDVGQPSYLSGGKWLHIAVDAKDVAALVPARGIVLSYTFAAPTSIIATPAAAPCEVWDRVGYEAARSPFDWRIDGGAWAVVAPDVQTIDLQQLQTWNPVAWLKLTTRALAPGAHTLEIRLVPTKNGKGEFQAINYASDAFCISAGPFRPNDQYRPGDMAWQTPEDRAAAASAFAVPVPRSAAQTEMPLSGLWQIARADEGPVTDEAAPVAEASNADGLFWKSMPVPGDRDKARPEWLYSHRYFLRTRLDVPAALSGRSLYLHFPAVSMLASVFVNGKKCGSTTAPFAVWDCDITRAVHPGVNEVWVGVKDWYYALPLTKGADGASYVMYEPTDWVTKFGPASFTFPVWNHEGSGILRAPSLVVAGAAYVSDVFAKPSVRTKTLSLEVSVTNPTDRPVTVSVGNSVALLAGGAAQKTFVPQDITVPAGGAATVQLSEGWANPTLWWPDAPAQYIVTTTLSLGDRAIDARTTKFGFREWDWHGPNFILNGVPWHGRADLADYNQATEAAAALWHRHGQTMQRMWTEDAVSGLDPEAALDFYDAHGIPIRRTGLFDGEAVKYHLDTPGLFDHWRTQLAAWVKGQRNHPSIFIWSMENEITFINGHVSGQDDLTTREMRKAWDVVRAVDPTRPAMTDGGNALLDESLPVYGGHYLQPGLDTLPEGAYDRAGFAHRQVWPITQSKPVLLGEDFFANGVDLADLATVGGESAFAGKAEAHPAIGQAARMLSEGYRWNDVNFHFWFGGETDAHYPAWQPVAVLCRQWDWTFGSHQKVTRTLGIFNDTHDAAPITLVCTLTVGGKQAARTSKVYDVPPGGSRKFDVVLLMPAATTRQEGTWALTLTRGGRPLYRDVKAVSVMPPLGSLTIRVYHRTAPPPARAPTLAVYDPSGQVIAFLSGYGLPFTRLTSLGGLPAGAKVLIVGRDALSPAQCTSSALAAYASGGHAVIVLEQKNPLRFQALPGEMALDADAKAGGIAFAEDLGHPVLHGLAQKDFFTWGADGAVYQDAYVKPASGGKSLVQCGERLQDTALAEMTPGRGVMLISQLLIGRKLAISAVAQRLLLNMAFYGLSYHQVFRPVTAVAGDDAPLVKAMDAVGLSYIKAGDPLVALKEPGGIAVVHATPASLHVLARNKPAVDAYTRAGGWLVLCGLTPAGLADYNALVGVDHLIRPFGQEKVTWPTLRSPLTAGLATASIVMGSGKQIFGYAAGQYPDADAYSYVLDTDDVAPFGHSPFFAWDKITNNYTQADGFWPLIINFPGPEPGKTVDIPISLPRSETITQFTYVQDLNYNATTKIALVFDGKDRVPLDVLPNGDPQVFALSPPRTVKEITLQIVDYDRKPGGGTNIGLDNIYLKSARPASFAQKVRSLLNIGALIEYPRGAGGLLLCNVKFQDSEANPENTGKKRAILATLLRNLHAPFSGAKMVIAGANNLTYTPLDLSKEANQYVTEQGWFGDKAFTFADLPHGRQTLANVPYSVYSFMTSPVPTAVMLGGAGVPGGLPDHVDGIPVRRKADALFFLQAARLDSQRNADEIKRGKKYEMADYVVHYADGTTARVPVYAEISIDGYKQAAPAALPGAQIAWAKSYAGTPFSAVAYSMQWNNPFPSKTITTVDLVYGPDRRGIPALLALTAASAR